MNAADLLWRLVANGILQGPQIERARLVLEVSEAELKAARARYECPSVTPPRELVAVAEHPYPGDGALVDMGPTRGTQPRHERVRVYTEAGRQRAAERAFTSLRVERMRCAICGDWIDSGDVVIVSRAHHASCAHKGRVA